MLERIITHWVARLLKSIRLSNESRQLLTATLLDKLGALPLHARITIDETGKCFVDGRPLSLEQAQKLKASARSLRNNYAWRLVGEQVTFMAIHKGVHENINVEQGLFGKAALWSRQEENTLYATLAQYAEDEEDA